MSSDLIPVEHQPPIEFGVMRSPDQLMKEAETRAAVFQREALRLNLYKRIGDSNHLLIEGWQMLGRMFGYTATTLSSHYVEVGDAHGWEASAELIDMQTGRRFSGADGMCMDDEDKWGMISKYEWQQGKKVKVGDVAKPMQQLRSMAQTRAQSKAFAGSLKWVAKMAGFATTPAEEMDAPDDAPQPRSNNISEAQTKRLYALAKQHGKSQEEMKAILQQFGFAHSKDITFDKYDAICAEVMKGEQQ